jgi:hypothetical protein
LLERLLEKKILRESSKEGFREIARTLFHEKVDSENRSVLPQGYDDMENQRENDFGEGIFTPPSEIEPCSLRGSVAKRYLEDLKECKLLC